MDFCHSTLQGDFPVENESEGVLPDEVERAAEEVFNPEDAAMEQSVRNQMESLYKRDVAMAAAFVGALLVVLPFIVVALWSVMPGLGTKLLLIAAGGVLLVYNVASMSTLVRNYRRDRDFIYRRDVAHLRELKVARQLARKERAAA
jgi:hypothetical protein